MYLTKFNDKIIFVHTTLSRVVTARVSFHEVWVHHKIHVYKGAELPPAQVWTQIGSVCTVHNNALEAVSRTKRITKFM